MTAQQSQAPRSTAAANNALLARFIHYSSAILAEKSNSAAAQVIARRINELLPNDRALLIRTRPSFSILASNAGHGELHSGKLPAALKKISRQQKSVTDIALLQSGDSHILWQPIRSKGHRSEYALWLERSTPWQEPEQTLAKRLHPFMQSALFQHQGKSKTGFTRPLLGLSAAIVAGVIFAWPVQLSAVASAEVVAAKPAYVYSPLNATLESVLVEPGDVVVKGQPLLEFDKQLLEQQVNEARENVAVELAELNRLERAGFGDTQARAELPVQKLKISKAKAALEYQLSQLQRASVIASQDGVVIMPEATSLEGSSVQFGQQLFSIAQPTETELLLKVPVKDRGIFTPGAAVKVRLDSDPLKVIEATATHAAYDVSSDSGEHPVVEVTADWQTTAVECSLLGQRGSARIYGERSHFGWQLIRKPLLAVLDIFGY